MLGLGVGGFRSLCFGIVCYLFACGFAVIVAFGVRLVAINSVVVNFFTFCVLFYDFAFGVYLMLLLCYLDCCWWLLFWWLLHGVILAAF